MNPIVPSLSFVRFEVHENLLCEFLEEAHASDEMIGLIVTGSVARGDARSGSDLDLPTLVKDDSEVSFESGVRNGVVVENKLTGFAIAYQKLEEQPMEPYKYLDGRILYDPRGKFVSLTESAEKQFEDYEPSDEEKRRLHYWLKSARDKVVSSRRAGDRMRTNFLVGTNSWKIIEGLWMANSRPVPPSGSLLSRAKDLSKPPRVEEKLRSLFLGEETERIETALGLMEWMLTRFE